MEWAPDTDAAHRGRTTVLARRERPQILLKQAKGEAGSSYGTPHILFTSAEDCLPQKDDAGTGYSCGDVGTDMSYTSLAEIALVKDY